MKNFPDFAAAVQARLAKGAATYGDRSFDADPLALLGEIQEELLDVCGWSFILHQRLELVRAALAAMPAPDANQDAGATP